MKKFKAILQSFIYILIILVINFGFISLFSFLFLQHNNIDINSDEYINSLAIFLTDKHLLIVLSSCLIGFSFLFPSIKKQNKIFNKQGLNYIGYYLLISISISMIFNIVLYDIGYLSITSFPSIKSIIATCLLGPILEEFLFRGVIYNKIQSCFSKKATIWIVSLLFTLYHGQLVQGIYAFIISFFVTAVYQKKKNIWLSICIHCVSNLSSAVLIPIALHTNIWIIQFMLLLFIIVLVISYQIMNEKEVLNHNNNEK